MFSALDQAITCTMLGNEEEGKEWWDKFTLIVEGGFDIPIKGEPENWCFKGSTSCYVPSSIQSTSAS